MDLDRPDSGATGLNIQRSMGSGATESKLSDVISSYRPTKVSCPATPCAQPLDLKCLEADNLLL